MPGTTPVWLGGGGAYHKMDTGKNLLSRPHTFITRDSVRFSHVSHVFAADLAFLLKDYTRIRSF